MGRLKQEFTIDFEDNRYTRACEIEGRILTDEEFAVMCDQFSDSLYTIEEYDFI